MPNKAVIAVKERLAICLISRSQVLADDVSFVVERVNHGLADIAEEVPPAPQSWTGVAPMDIERIHGGQVLEMLMAQTECYLRDSVSASRVALEVVLLHFESLEKALTHCLKIPRVWRWNCSSSMPAKTML